MSKLMHPNETILRDYDLEIARLRQDIAESNMRAAHMEYERALYAATGTTSINPAIDSSFRQRQIDEATRSYIHN
jgi:hypothetical protein